MVYIAGVLTFAASDPIASPQTPCGRIGCGFSTAFGYVSGQTRHHRKAGAQDDTRKFRSSGILNVISKVPIRRLEEWTLPPESHLGSNVANVHVEERSYTVD